jgi:hypothetical protein
MTEWLKKYIVNNPITMILISIVLHNMTQGSDGPNVGARILSKITVPNKLPTHAPSINSPNLDHMAEKQPIIKEKIAKIINIMQFTE